MILFVFLDEFVRFRIISLGVNIPFDFIILNSDIKSSPSFGRPGQVSSIMWWEIVDPRQRIASTTHRLTTSGRWCFAWLIRLLYIESPKVVDRYFVAFFSWRICSTCWRFIIWFDDVDLCLSNSEEMFKAKSDMQHPSRLMSSTSSRSEHSSILSWVWRSTVSGVCDSLGLVKGACCQIFACV